MKYGLIKWILILTLTLFLRLEAKDEICIPIEREKVSKATLQQLSRLYNLSSNKILKDTYERKKMFAKEYLKKFGLSKEEEIQLKILITNFLSKNYVKKFLETKYPTDEEAKSYYLLHQQEYHQKFDKIKGQIKRKMLNLKAPQLIEEEYNRLKTKYENKNP